MPLSLLVAGSFGLDTIRMPDGRVYRDVLGGSGTYFSLAASLLAKGVRVAGAVGGDFPRRHLRLLRGRGVDTEGLAIVPEGKTFRWSGTYKPNMDDRVTDDLQFGVLASHRPKLPPSCRRPDLLFLACAAPSLQGAVLRQAGNGALAVCDTIEVYIRGDRAALLKVLRACGGVIVNESEARLLLGDDNTVRCAQALCRMGPRFAVVKQGAHGSVLAAGKGGKDGIFPLPAWPLGKVADPTGAGDSFAGGFMGWLARTGKRDTAALRHAMRWATAVASFTCGGVGPSRLARLAPAELAARHRALGRLLDPSAR